MQRKKFLNQKGDQVMNSRISQSGVNSSFFFVMERFFFLRDIFFLSVWLQTVVSYDTVKP